MARSTRGLRFTARRVNGSGAWATSQREFGGVDYELYVTSFLIRFRFHVKITRFHLHEFKNAYDELANVTIERPYALYDRTQTPFRDVTLRALGISPWSTARSTPCLAFSLNSYAILQQSPAWLRYSPGTGFRSTDWFGQALYKVGNVANKLGDGVVAYPAPEDEKTGKSMGFKLKNVTFTYPVSQSSQNALFNISLSIKPSHLVVIVGTNGSGKSTLIRILSRLYDYAFGEHPLAKELEGLRKTIDLSGCEKQKLVAAHTFMRFHSNLIKFVARDEPSSALDAEAEVRLFRISEDSLKQEREKLWSMKDGTVAKMGLLEELMKKDGESAKLYDIRANAFAPGEGIGEGVANA
ncbi:P-loop containing nucleoside triphosphate hydrolase protein [Panaeolus papilionaceus]|nr:P-loop containing nucleoside triphosphate hydrolase protein [Panaeolus papilionaceus]